MAGIIDEINKNLVEHGNNISAIEEKLEDLQLHFAGMVDDFSADKIYDKDNIETFILSAGTTSRETDDPNYDSAQRKIIVKGQPVISLSWNNDDKLINAREVPATCLERCYGIAVEDCVAKVKEKKAIGYCQTSGIIVARVAGYGQDTEEDDADSEPSIGDFVGVKQGSDMLHPEYNNVGVLLTPRNNNYALILILPDNIPPLYQATADAVGDSVAVKRLNKNGTLYDEEESFFVIE